MRYSKIDIGSKSALVTGGSGGIGFEFADLLAGLGYNVVIVAQDDAKLAEAHSELERRHTQINVCSLGMDLCDPVAPETVYEWCRSEDWQIDVLINCAGMFAYCDVVAMDYDRMERIVNLNSLVVCKMCRLFGEDMAERKEGYILNISSFSLWMPLPGLSLYAASKAFVRTFSVAFAKEMRERGVRVTVTCPAGVKTDLYGLSPKLQNFASAIGALITPRSCAKRSLKAMWSGKRCIVPDWWNRFWIPLVFFLPNSLTSLVRRKTKKFQK